MDRRIARDPASRLKVVLLFGFGLIGVALTVFFMLAITPFVVVAFALAAVAVGWSDSREHGRHTGHAGEEAVAVGNDSQWQNVYGTGELTIAYLDEYGQLYQVSFVGEDSVDFDEEEAVVAEDPPPSLSGVRTLGAVMTATFAAFALTLAAMGLGAAAVVVVAVFVGSSLVPLLLIRRAARAAVPQPMNAASHEASGPERLLTTIEASPAHVRVVEACDLLYGIKRKDVAAVIGLGEWEWAPAGTRLAEAGTQGHFVYVIADGQVQLSGRSELGELTVRVADPGESFPLATLVGDGTLVSSAAAMSDCVLLTVRKDVLQDFCNRRPQVGLQIFRTVAEVLGERYRATLAARLHGLRAVVADSRHASHV